MRIPVGPAIILLLFFCFQTTAQEINVRANLSVHAITDFENGFIGGGLGVEGALSRHWSVGADVSWASNSDLSIFNFNPTVRFYFGRALQGFYLGLGGNINKLSRDIGPVGYPIQITRGSPVVVGGPEASLGVQARINNRITMGIKTGLTLFTDIDLDENVGFNLNFTVGALLF